MMAKVIAADSAGLPTIADYSSAYRFKFYPRRWPDLAAMARTLKGLSRRHYHCIVRAAPAEGLDLDQEHRRLLHPAEDGDQPTLRDVPRAWCELDFDHGNPLPGGFDWRADPRRALDLLMARDLPAEFKDVDCVAMFSSSQGFKPEMRWRAFFLLDRPYGGRELAVIFESLVRRGHRVDPALARAIQPHYVATPLFRGGILDPLPGGRVFVFEKSSRRAVLPVVPATVGGGASRFGNHRPFTGGFPRAVLRLLDEMRSGNAFHQQWIRAFAIWFDAFGPDVDVVPLMLAVDDVLRDFAVPLRGQRYRDQAWRQMADFAVALRTRERRTREVLGTMNIRGAALTAEQYAAMAAGPAMPLFPVVPRDGSEGS